MIKSSMISRMKTLLTRTLEFVQLVESMMRQRTVVNPMHLVVLVTIKKMAKRDLIRMPN